MGQPYALGAPPTATGESEMSLHTPCFRLEAASDGTHKVRYNCNGNLNFTADVVVDAKTARLIEFAIEEGKQRRSRELMQLLSGG